MEEIQPKPRNYMRGFRSTDWIRWETREALPCRLVFTKQQLEVPAPHAEAALARAVQWPVPSQKNLLDIGLGAARSLWINQCIPDSAVYYFACATLTVKAVEEGIEALWEYQG